MVEPKLANDDDRNPLSFSSERFTGRFHGYYGREFTIKPKSSYFRRDSLSNSILIHGKLKPLDENRLSLTVIFHRTDFAKYGQWVQKAIYGLIILIMGTKLLMNSDYISFLILGGALFFFYWFATLIAIGQAGGQIKYFERYFFEGLRVE